jgi:hypothetical protein
MISPRQLLPSRHVVFIRRSHQVPDHVQLMCVTFASQNGLSEEHLTQNTATLIVRTKENGDFQNHAYPTPQTSIAGVYCRSCSKSSGGRYHRVTTRPV